MTRKRDKVLLIILTIPVILFTLIGVAYSFVYVPASDDALARDYFMQETSQYYYFNSPMTEAAIVMYPGGFVEPLAYAPLAQRLQDAHLDVYLLKLPLNFALLGIQTPERIRLGIEEDLPFYVMGHSLGGVAAAEYVKRKGDLVDGMIMLASYPAQDLSGIAIDYLSIVGSLDTVLNQDAYDEAKPYWPSGAHEEIIEGGNHAQFGDYGDQKGDTLATIDLNTQQIATVEIIVDFIITT